MRFKTAATAILMLTIGLLAAPVPSEAFPPTNSNSSRWTGPDPTLAPPPPPFTALVGDDDNWIPTDGDAGGSSTGACAHLTKGFQVKRYESVQVWGNMPLRCGYSDGAKGWGFAKMVAKGRWNPWYDGMIGAPLQNPANIVYQGTSARYESQWFPQCNPPYKFVVVTESKDFGGVGRRGIITAYQKYEK